MNTLMIKDLSIAEQLDSKAMRAVRGGTGYGYPSSSYFNFAPVWAPNTSKNVTASQVLGTTMNIFSENGNNDALVAGNTTSINPHVMASNNITVA